MPTSSDRTHPPVVPGPYRLWHGGDYNPEQWLHRPEILAEDARLMPLAGMNQASVGIFAWSALEPAPGDYRFDWLDATLDRLHAAGVGVLLATPTAARPRWLAEAHPEVMCTRRNGQRDANGSSRHNFCWTSPVYRERSAALITRMAERYAGHPALLGWHLSNEYNGSDDASRCYCAGCVAGFRAWLKRRYHDDLDALNRAWWTRFWSHSYQSWEQIRPDDHVLDGLMLNWHRYTSELVVDFARHEIAAVRRHSTKPVTTNWHGDIAGHDHGAMARVLDVVSYDSYPDIDGSAGDRTSLAGQAFIVDAVRAHHRGRPWLLLESCPGQPQYKPVQRIKRPGVHRALSLAMVGHGADAICYFQWRAGCGGMEKMHGAVLMQDAPHDTAIFRQVAALGRDLNALAAVAGSAVPAEVAVVWDVESQWSRGWNSGLNSLPNPWTLAKAAHRPLLDAGIGVDVVDGVAALDGYRVIIVAGVFLLRPGFAERVVAAAEAGAIVLIDALSAWVDEDVGCIAGGRPGPVLRPALGLHNEELDQLREDERIPVTAVDGWLPAGTQVRGHLDVVHADDCTVLARASGGFHDGRPLLTRRAHGRGALLYLAARFDGDGLGHLLRKLCADAGVAPCLPGIPRGIFARERRQPDRRFVFLVNPGDEAVEVPLDGCGWRDALTGVAAGAALVLGGWDARVLVAPG